jgi:hypothetical protein
MRAAVVILILLAIGGAVAAGFKLATMVSATWALAVLLLTVVFGVITAAAGMALLGAEGSAEDSAG